MRTTFHELGLDDFIGDVRLSLRLKIENFLLVELGLRPCSQATLPFDLVGAPEMGIAIDKRIYPLMDQLKTIRDPRSRLKAIERIKGEMKVAFKEIVESSGQYSALVEWCETFKLRRLSYPVRPTVQDLYLVRDKEVESKLKRLMKQRDRIRNATGRLKSAGLNGIRFAYPEEFLGGWLREMGELLGYPRCCVDRYASEREGGSSVEDRAARELAEAESRDPPDPFAYFVGYFFPCSPRCEQAISKGQECHEGLQSLDPRLGELYRSLAAENLEIVRRQPNVISEFRSKVANTRRLSAP